MGGQASSEAEPAAEAPASPEPEGAAGPEAGSAPASSSRGGGGSEGGPQPPEAAPAVATAPAAPELPAAEAGEAAEAEAADAAGAAPAERAEAAADAGTPAETAAADAGRGLQTAPEGNPVPEAAPLERREESAEAVEVESSPEPERRGEETVDLTAEPESSGYGTEEAEVRLVKGIVQRIGPELPRERAVECYETLSRVLGNVLTNPSEPKFRMIKKASLRKKLGGSPDALSLLLIVGFDDDGDLFTLHPSTDMAAMRAGLAAVQEALLGLGSLKALRYLQQAEGSRAPAPAAGGGGATTAAGAAATPQAAPAAAPAPSPPAQQQRQQPAAAWEPPAEVRVAAPAARAKPPEAQLVVRLATAAGRSRLVLPPSATLGELREKVAAVSGVAPRLQKLSLKPDGRPLSGSSGVRLADLGIASGAALYLSNADATMVSVKLAAEMKPVLEASALVGMRPGEVERYWDDGVVGPLNGPDRVQTARCRDGLARYFEQSRGRFEQRIFAGHVLQPWIYDLACHPSIVGAVASVLRTDTVFLYQSILIPRPPGEIGIGWHADGGGYRPLQPQRHFITAFVALSPCRKENGCLEFQRQSNGSSFLMELDEGQFSLHSATVQHTTTRNTSHSPRICVVFRYISGEVYDVARGMNADRDFAVLMCGRDAGGHFRLLKRPNGECTPEGQETWEEMKRIREERYGKLV